MVADALVHAAGILLAPPAALLLLYPTGGAGDAGPTPLVMAALVLYVLGISGMLAASAAYNLAPPGAVKAWLRRLDHALIFGAIAGTYTPFLLLGMPGTVGTVLVTAMWGLAVLGATLKLRGRMGSPRLSTALYLSLGWIGVPAFPVLATMLKAETLWMVGAGALLYSVGAVIHLMDRLRFHNAIWHAMVLAAAACHYIAIRCQFAPGA
ncbi:PAQR family membrane homeostasis protein TrhA [Rhodocista pekingensis]|uniref:Hemolysin III family protein n=1 Tax=Rhodocista pekingensis TaxID=201185 RepID=A0ABW2KV06_9PROT